ncbi:MAG: patatin-like phospholipase family protein [bacterium]|nr:patatin-like phospholipase family protein [bacterium]
MPSTPCTRADFLAWGAAAAVSAAALPAAADDVEAPQRLDYALVLSGGGARGAYEAGLIDYLRLARGAADFSALAPYQIVCGTSIGALNGYFVATGQYSLLRELWYGIARQDVVRLKRRYAKIANPDSGVGTRIAAGMRLILSLTSHDTGVIDGEHLRAWMAHYIDPERPVVIPFVWPVTNLSTQSPEFFYLIDRRLSGTERARAAQAIRTVVGPNAVLREATPELLIDALRASAAIPVAFDPVSLPSARNPDLSDQYVDGGVTANTPVSVARAAAHNVHIVMLDPPFERAEYANAFDIGYGVFGAMQRRILEADLRAAYLETFGKRAMETLPQQADAYAHAHGVDIASLRAFAARLFDSEIAVVRPERELPVSVVGFDDAANIFATFKLGFEAARAGFAPYVFS